MKLFVHGQRYTVHTLTTLRMAHLISLIVSTNIEGVNQCGITEASANGRMRLCDMRSLSMKSFLVSWRACPIRTQP